MTEYAWTDWIQHIPGQELLPGTYVLMEFVNRERNVWTKEGQIDASHKGHPCWRMRTPNGPAVMITRYKIRLDADLTEEEADEHLPDLIRA
ncbi:hypothetical protein [Hyphomicrobium sp. ghe19]|uniref:hypothetical protein n=1 Tax=Hyphomicrobium sp. ghe19 TaxID=2682968 RepID=UPI001367242A|nr:hypothetical protein HYPP_01500 [Hyphomicrobium sp. ghe19]